MQMWCDGNSYGVPTICPAYAVIMSLKMLVSASLALASSPFVAFSICALYESIRPRKVDLYLEGSTPAMALSPPSPGSSLMASFAAPTLTSSSGSAAGAVSTAARTRGETRARRAPARRAPSVDLGNAPSETGAARAAIVESGRGACGSAEAGSTEREQLDSGYPQPSVWRWREAR